MNVTQEICKAFNSYSEKYEENAKIQIEIGTRLFERLEYLTMQPQYILDLGCGSGYFTSLLRKRYPQAQLVSIDLAQLMLVESKKKQQTPDDWHLICGNMQTLPFHNGIFDLVFANQVIHWTPALTVLFRELNRVMRSEGCLMFTTLGPDTFKEFKQAWQAADTFTHAHDFLDMHHIGDTLVKEHLLEPVVDMEIIQVHYASLTALTTNLKAQGVRNIHKKRNRGLTGKNAWQSFEAAYEKFCTPEGKYPLTYEIIFGHAWKGSQRISNEGLEVVFPLSKLRR